MVTSGGVRRSVQTAYPAAAMLATSAGRLASGTVSTRVTSRVLTAVAAGRRDLLRGMVLEMIEAHARPRQGGLRARRLGDDRRFWSHQAGGRRARSWRKQASTGYCH